MMTRTPAFLSLAFLGAALISGGPLFADDVPLPPGFSETSLIHGHPARGGARDIEWTEDGSLMFYVQSGPGEGNKIWVYKDGSWGDTVPALELVGTSPNTGERGINGIAVDPDYATNRRLWVYYTDLNDPIHNRLSTFEYDETSDTLHSEQVILDGPPLDNNIHNGGCLAFAPDGTLFLGIGDDGRFSTTGQNPFDVRGSILHMNTDGTGASDNPYLDGVSGDSRVWAIGVRNPFRCNIQAYAGGGYNLWFGDVGGATWEEINLGVAGANFGWATVEGPEPPGVSGMTYPFYFYSHDGAGAAVIGGDHVEHGEFYEPYEHDYFFADWTLGEIYHMDLDENNSLVSVETWYSFGPATVTDIEFGPDGAMYVAAIGASRQNVYKIEYVGGTNRQPIALLSATPDSGPAPLVVSLDGTASSDPDGDTLSYDWDLGDGTMITDGNPTEGHTYAQGVYSARLTVDDGPSHGGDGLADVSPPVRIVSGNQRPTAKITGPTVGLLYNAGDVIAYSGTGTDPEEGVVPCSQFVWYAHFHHGEHTHPAFGPNQGSCSDSFTIPTTGETAPDVWYRIYLAVEDTGLPIGDEATLSDLQYVEIFPNKSFMTFESAPLPDLELSLDTTSFTPPITLQGVVGILRQVGAPALQLGSDGKHYWWESWSDGMGREHVISTPPTDTTFTATFECALEEAEQLAVDKSGPGLVLRWLPPVIDGCVTTTVAQYRVYSSPTARPGTPPGDFPADPEFAQIGTSGSESFDYPAPAVGDEYFLVTPVGANSLEGVAGHYGF